MRHVVFSALLIVFPLIIPRLSFGQGGLTPPGAPGPTMKTLSQVEPRTPISSLPHSITNAGSYYAVTNLTRRTHTLSPPDYEGPRADFFAITEIPVVF